MPKISFEDLPAHGRLWVFPASRYLTQEEADRCLNVVDEFLSSWSAHGVPLCAGRELVEKRFLLVGVDIDVEAPSGCSIDALVKQLSSLGAELGLSFIDHSSIWFREAKAVRTVSRSSFKALVEQGVVGPSTSVFDTTLTTIGQAREDRLERTAEETWHGRAFLGVGVLD